MLLKEVVEMTCFSKPQCVSNFSYIPGTMLQENLCLRAGCTPRVKANLLLFTNLYRHQNRKDQGFPPNANLNCGSKYNLFFPIERSNMTAGLPNVKVGIKETPLFVTVPAPLIWYRRFVLSVDSEKQICVSN